MKWMRTHWNKRIAALLLLPPILQLPGYSRHYGYFSSLILASIPTQLDWELPRHLPWPPSPGLAKRWDMTADAVVLVFLRYVLPFSFTSFPPPFFPLLFVFCLKKICIQQLAWNPVQHLRWYVKINASKSIYHYPCLSFMA